MILGPLYQEGAVCAPRRLGEFFEPILFFLCQKEKNGFNLPRKERGLCKTGSASRAAIASEEASSIPFPPGRRKLHIRSLLLPSQIVTVSLGHNLAIWNFTTPHAILMMAGRRLLSDTVKTETFLRRKSRARLWSMESPENHPKGSLVVSFLFLLEPKGDPAQRSAFGKEEGGCEYGAFAAPAEAQCSWLLLTPRRFFSFSKRERKEWGRKKRADRVVRPYGSYRKCSGKSKNAIFFTYRRQLWTRRRCGRRSARKSAR